MNISLIVESMAIDKRQENLSNNTKRILTESIKDDGELLFAHIIGESADESNSTTLKEKIIKLWEAIKAYANNLTKYLMIKLNEKTGLYKKLASKIDEIYDGYDLCKNTTVENMYYYGDIFTKKPERVIKEVIMNVLSKNINVHDTITITGKESQAIAKEVEDALNKKGLTDNSIGELKQIDKIGDIEIDLVVTSISRYSQVSRELKNYLTILNGFRVLLDKASGIQLTCKMNVMRVGSKYLSKYMRYAVDNLMQSVKIAKICIRAYEDNKNK